MTKIRIDFFPPNVKLLITTLMKETKTLVAVKLHFDNRDQSLLVTNFGKMGQLRFKCNNQNQFFSLILSYSRGLRLSKEISKEASKPVFLEIHEIE